MRLSENSGSRGGVGVGHACQNTQASPLPTSLDPPLPYLCQNRLQQYYWTGSGDNDAVQIKRGNLLGHNVVEE